MWETFWNIAGLIGLFGFVVFAIYFFIVSTFRCVFGASFCLILFIVSTSLFPGEEEIVEEIADSIKIYQRGIENEERGAFKRAKVDYKIVLHFDPQDKEAIEKLELLERREIALTFLEVAKKLRRKRKFAVALVKLKVAEEIAPLAGTLEDSSELRDRIKKELKYERRDYEGTSIDWLASLCSRLLYCNLCRDTLVHLS